MTGVSIPGWGTDGLALASFRAAAYAGVFTLLPLLPLLSGEGRERHGAILREAAVGVDAGQLTPQLAPRRFTLADAGDAHALVATGRGQGAVVVDVAA